MDRIWFLEAVMAHMLLYFGLSLNKKINNCWVFHLINLVLCISAPFFLVFALAGAWPFRRNLYDDLMFANFEVICIPMIMTEFVGGLGAWLMLSIWTGPLIKKIRRKLLN